LPWTPEIRRPPPISSTATKWVGQQMTVLASASARLAIGRGEGCDLHFYWDHEVSRLHAQLERIGIDWVLVDDGLSRNGTYINDERSQGRHRLRDGDVILTGSTTISYRANRIPPSPDTKVAQNVVTVHSLSPTQRQVITALCRPYTSGSPYATPATNQQLAEEIFLSVDSVKKSPAHPVRKVRRRGSSAEPETGAACRAGLQVRPGIRADRVTAHAGQPDVGCHLRACAVRLLGGVQDGQRSGVQIGDIRLSAIR
jgi:pSer/pThr/pTyr-binding forkhead associated (FHA) protein